MHLVESVTEWTKTTKLHWLKQLGFYVINLVSRILWSSLKRNKYLAYRKVASSNTSCLEAHADFFQIAYEGDFRVLCTVTFWQKVDFLISNAH